MEGRVAEGEQERLRGYLSPNISEEEKKDIQTRRELVR